MESKALLRARLKALLVTRKNANEAIKLCRTEADRKFSEEMIADLDHEIRKLRRQLRRK